MSNQIYDNESVAYLNEAKVLLVGQGGVGKTSIVKALTRSEFSASEEITSGIEIKPWNIKSEEKEYKLNIWDFGGQEIMHATHQFFFTERSLYILAIDSRLGERQSGLEYWLKLIQIYGGDSPIIVVGNKADQHHLDIDKKGLRKKYKNILEIIETSCLSGEGIDTLCHAISNAIPKLPHVNSAIPSRWLSIRNDLDKMNRDYIGFSEFQDICVKHDIADEKSQIILLSFLHDLGVIFHFQGDPTLDNTNVLNPNWVTNGVYRIINSRQLHGSNGIMTEEQLHDILSGPEYPRDKRFFIVDMMKKFELCFELEGGSEKRYLIPELLPKEEPDADSSIEATSFEYNYGILPRSIISRFIVRMNPFVHEGVYWRNGVKLKYGDNYAFIKSDAEDRKITIRVWGNEDTKYEFLSKLRFQFESIHKSIPNLEFRTKIQVPNHPEVFVDYDQLMVMADKGVTTYIPEGMTEKIDVWETLGGFRKDFYKKVKGISRLRYLDMASILLAMLGAILAIAALAFQVAPSVIEFLHNLFLSSESVFISSAYADSGKSSADHSSIDTKSFINAGIMFCIIIAFIWTLAVSLHSESSAKVRRANDLNKMILGFLIGSGKSYMGL